LVETLLHGGGALFHRLVGWCLISWCLVSAQHLAGVGDMDPEGLELLLEGLLVLGTDLRCQVIRTVLSQKLRCFPPLSPVGSRGYIREVGK